MILRGLRLKDVDFERGNDRKEIPNTPGGIYLTSFQDLPALLEIYLE